MVIDFEITLNRFGFYRPASASNKIQIGFLRISWWRGLKKTAISFEINWYCGKFPQDGKIK